MLYYELKKVFTKKGSQVALVLVGILLVTAVFLAVKGVSWTEEDGTTHLEGYQAAKKLKEAGEAWYGPLTEEKLSAVIAENTRVNETPQGQSQDVTQSNIAYSWKQGFREIREMLNRSFGEFRSYDYYTADALKPADAACFYSNRIKNLETWLASDEEKDRFSEAEKQFLISRYQELETPFEYQYAEGWKQLFEYAPTVVMILMLILGFLVAGIFSGEFQTKADALFFSSMHGRGKASRAKVEAGFLIVTMLYWAVFLLYSLGVLGILGFEGADCPIQISGAGWKSFYNITFWEEYILIAVGGYIGCVFMAALTMLVSAKTKSSVLAVIVPFVLIFGPSMISFSRSVVVEKILGLFPDWLLRLNQCVGMFYLYSVGGKQVGAIPILLVLYGVLAVLLQPLLYRVYRRQAR
ncbi:MAG: ABC transporter permease [Eubacteriales bacterium]|nr:ABC transporter permease [Eubacteriales bacterium]